ncbi:MAG: carboxypeptidase regulatory-like domain-containing protein [Acidobacteriota bacterium]|nr:carboxypeptidase regulatory-like domain-containing protein [Acidobacteriota bacterium]
MTGRKYIEIFVVIIAALTLSLSAFGQATTSLRGTVFDPTGASIPGAKVTLINSGTNLSRETTTGTNGQYYFPAVMPGTYKLTVQAQGFSTYSESGLPLLVNLPATENVHMQVGAVSQTVQVTSKAPLLNTTDASLGKTMGSLAINQLPLRAENMPLLLSFQPGVVYNGQKILTDDYDTRAGSVNGERSDQNNITLDGVSINNEFAGYAFNGVLPTTQFSVQEFRVSTSNYGATQGRSAGAQIAMVTKGGTNQFHCSLYEFNRSDVGEANDYFLKLSQLANGQPNVPEHLVRNVFGGTFGGPIKKNKLFFFINYEGHRVSQAASAVVNIPSATLRQGIIQYECGKASQCPGGSVIGESGASFPVQPGYYALGPAQLKQMDPLGIGPNQVVLNYFNKTYPEPNDFSVGNVVNYAGYRFGAPEKSSDNYYIGRLDYKLTDKNSLFFRWTSVDDPSTGIPFLPGGEPLSTSLDLSKGFVAGYTAILAPNWINNLRYGLTRQSISSSGTSDQPWVLFRGLDEPISRPSGFVSPVHNLIDTVSAIEGSHNIQFGGNILWMRQHAYNANNSFSDTLLNSDWVFPGGFANHNSPLNPAYGCTNSGPCFPAVASPDFNNAYDFPLAAMMGIASEIDAQYNYKVVNQTTAAPLAQGAPVIRNWATGNYNFFAQDTWRLRHNLSITYGLNYQLMTPLTETSGQEVIPTVNMGDWFNQRAADAKKGIPANQDALIEFSPGGAGNTGRPGMYSPQTRNFAPRIGVAWSPESQGGLLEKVFGNGQTAIRGGFGIYYDNFGPELGQTFDATGTFGLTSSLQNPAQSVTVASAPRVTNMNVIPTTDNNGNNIMPAAPPSTYPAVFPVGAEAITQGIDQSVQTPRSFAADFSIDRTLPGQMTLDVSYVGHFGRRLLAYDDIGAPNDLVDPKTGIDYFAAASRLSQLGRAGTPDSAITASLIGPTAQYWTDMLTPQASYPLCSSNGATTSLLVATYDQFGPKCNLYNETSAIYNIDVNANPTLPITGLNSYYNSQYSSLWTWRSIAYSNYNALEVSLNKRMSNGVLFGFNYTFSKDNDIQSMAERAVHYLTDSIINPWSPGQMYAPADMDLRHQINGYWVAQLPFGQGKFVGRDVNGWENAIIGGWQFSGTTRWTSGYVASVFQDYVWPTNWDEMGWSNLTGSPIATGRSSNNGSPNVFKNPSAAIKGFTYAYPGQSGERNTVRGDGFYDWDMSLAKSWKVRESQALQFRWNVFNVMNIPRFDVYSMQDEVASSNTFGNYSQTLTQPRVMEFSLIYQF